MSGYTRQGAVPLGGPSRKRKEREEAAVTRAPLVGTKSEPPKSPAASSATAGAGNRLLAGYLAHEYLTRGTLLGQRWDPAAKSGPGKAAAAAAAGPGPDQQAAAGRAYADVAYLLRSDGAHIPGIVNPTQLGRWLQM